MSTSIIPRPGEDLVPEGWWRDVVVPWADEQVDVDDVARGTSAIAGLIAAYRVVGADTLELTRARRYLEVRWGQLLGDAQMGRPTEESSHASELSKDDRLRFRQLASHRDQVVDLLEHATDPDEITRASCMRLAKPPAPSARDAASSVGWSDEDDDDLIADVDGQWTSAHDRQRKRIDDLIDNAQTLLANASSPRYTPQTRAITLRDAEVMARQAAGQLGELAFSFER